MKIISKNQMVELLNNHPDGGVVFAEYTPDYMKTGVNVSDGRFGAREVIPYHGEVFDWDWNIEEYREDALFAVFDNQDILQMIQTLTCSLQLELKDE